MALRCLLPSDQITSARIQRAHAGSSTRRANVAKLGVGESSACSHDWQRLVKAGLSLEDRP